LEKNKVRKLLLDVKRGRVAVSKALKEFRHLPYEDIGFAKIDHHRDIRRGFPEVVFCSGKNKKEIVEIARRILKSGQDLFATRSSPFIFKAIREIAPAAKYFEKARIVCVRKNKMRKSRKVILVVTAGTADITVAEEAAVTAEVMGNTVERLYDVGVAGLHRLIQSHRRLFAANVIIVVAGMEGALASVVAGLVDKPVIAVPTSIGYGASFRGLAALLTMLNSCAPGVAVVNIDNGFGAGYLAGIINKLNEAHGRI
jgi:NCAIR mutase (PurE)-related protein